MKVSKNKGVLMSVISGTLLFSPFTSAVTFQELSDMGTDSYLLIDCRQSSNFNGWPEVSGAKGGHIPNAVNLSANWLFLMSDKQLEDRLEQYNFAKNTPIFLHCEQKDADKVASKIRSLGFKSVEKLEGKLSDYSGHLNSLDNFHKLVPTSWLKALLDKKTVDYIPSGDFKVIEVAWGIPRGYLVSHIPGALYLNTNDIESEEKQWNRVDNHVLEQTLQNLGVTHKTTVILYGRDNMAAARAASIFMYAGVRDVRMLDGGWDAWRRHEYETEAGINNAEPVSFGTEIPANPELIIDVEEAKTLLENGEKSSLVSIRTWKEYTGEISGYSYIKHKGRISGSKWGYAGSDAYHLEEYHNIDGTMRTASEIEKLWEKQGITRDQDIAFYCGTGWRASEVFFYAYVMGWQNISVFDGGWFEWSNNPDNPVETGVPAINTD